MTGEAPHARRSGGTQSPQQNQISHVGIGSVWYLSRSGRFCIQTLYATHLDPDFWVYQELSLCTSTWRKSTAVLVMKFSNKSVAILRMPPTSVNLCALGQENFYTPIPTPVHSAGGQTDPPAFPGWEGCRPPPNTLLVNNEGLRPSNFYENQQFFH